MPVITWEQMISQFAKALLEWVKAGAPLASKRQHHERWETCKGCPKFRDFYCTECKCLCYLKTKLSTESCPDGKWSPLP